MANVATLTVKVTANISDFEKQLGKLEGQWKRQGAKLESIGSNLTRSVTLPLLGISAAALKVSMDFETAMTKTVTLAGETRASMEGLKSSVIELSKETGIGPVALADALVAIESNGLKGQEALDVLAASAKGSAIGMGSAVDIGRALTAVMNAYGSSGLTASQAADQFHQTVLLGGADASTLAGEFGRVIGLAANLGVTFGETGAFIATYTQLGLSASEATTALSGILNTILNPSKEARDALAGLSNDMGQKMTPEMLRAQVRTEGLGATLTSLIAKLHGNEDATGALFGNVRALAGVMGTAGVQAERYKSNLNTILTTSGSLNAAFKEWEGTTAGTWAKFTAGVQAAAIAIGDDLAPAFSKVVTNAIPAVEQVGKLANAFTNLPVNVQTGTIDALLVGLAAGPIVLAISNIYKLGAAMIGLMRFTGLAGLLGTVGKSLKELVTFSAAFKWEGFVVGLGGISKAIFGLASASPIGFFVKLGLAIITLSKQWDEAILTMLAAPLGGLLRSWRDLHDAIGDVTMPDLPKAPGAKINAPLGPAMDIKGAMAMLNAPFVLAKKGAGGGSDESPLAKAIKGIQDRMKDAVVDAKAWSAEIAREGGVTKATTYAKDQLADALANVIKMYGSLKAAGLGAMEPIFEATQKVLESSRAIPSELAAYTSVLMGAGSNLGGMMAQLGMLPSSQGTVGSGALKGSLGKYTSLQDLANDAGMSGAPGIEDSVNVAEQVSAYAQEQMAASAKETVDGIRKAFQYFTGSLGGGMAALLGGVMNALEKGAAKGGFLQKLFGGKTGEKIGTGLDIGLAAFGGGFGMGEQFGKGKGALGGAASGALSGAMVAGPFGAIVGGLAGLFGGLFGGRAKAKKERAAMADSRNQLVDQFGGMDNLRKQADLAGVSIDLLFSTTKPEVFKAELEKVGDAIKVMQERIKSTISEVDDVMSKGGIITADLWKKILPDAGADEIKTKLKEVFVTSVNQAAEGFNKIATNFELLKRPISEIGVLAQAAFGGLLTAGASLPEAIAAIEPGLAHLREIMKPGENAGGPLGELLNWQGIIEKNKGLFELLAGTQSMLTGLANSGLLTQQTFSALGATISQAFGQLTAHGVAAGTALQMMQPQLQALWKLEKDRGLTLDANTQKLINQAVQQGIVGPQMASVEDKMLQVMLAIAKVLGADIPAALAGLPGAAGAAVDAISPKFDALKAQASGVFNGIPHSIDIDMRLHGSLPPGDLAAALGVGGGTGSHSPTSNDWATHIPHLAAGGIVTRPTTLLAGEAGPEAIVPLNDYMQGGGVNLNIQNVYGDVDEKLVRQIFNKVAIGGSLKTHAQGSLR